MLRGEKTRIGEKTRVPARWVAVNFFSIVGFIDRPKWAVDGDPSSHCAENSFEMVACMALRQNTFDWHCDGRLNANVLRGYKHNFGDMRSNQLKLIAAAS